MNSTTLYIKRVADAMEQFGYVLGNEAEHITKADLLAIAETLQSNVNSLLTVAESLPEDRLN